MIGSIEMLKVYNSKTKQKEVFGPFIEFSKAIGMYVCGPTVYDSLHIGHARSMICMDVIRRHILHEGYYVTYIMNLTDIDDKIINRVCNS